MSSRDPLPSPDPEQPDAVGGVPAWFAEAPFPAEGTILTASTARRPRRKIGIWIVLVGVVLLGAGGVVACLVMRPASCIDRSAYAGIVAIVRTANGDSVGTTDLRLGEPVGTFSVYFESGSTDIDDELSYGLTDFIQSVGEFARKNHRSAPITVQVQTRMMSTADGALGAARLAQIKSVLVAAGVPLAQLSVADPTLVPHDDEEDNDDVIDGTLPVLISVTPTSDRPFCQ